MTSDANDFLSCICITREYVTKLLIDFVSDNLYRVRQSVRNNADHLRNDKTVLVLSTAAVPIAGRTRDSSCGRPGSENANTG